MIDPITYEPYVRLRLTVVKQLPDRRQRSPVGLCGSLTDARDTLLGVLIGFYLSVVGIEEC